MAVPAALSLAGRIAPWALTAAPYLPGVASAIGGWANQSGASYRPGGGRMRTSQGAGVPTLNAIQTGKYGPTDWNPSANPLAQVETLASVSSPIDRAYQQEKANIAQLTEQDPLFKKYQVADLTKAYNAAKSPEEKEKIGLQIWATTNPELAKRVRPGQVGYQTSASLRGSQVFGTDVPGVTEAVYQQASEAAGLPSTVSFTPGAMPVTTAFGLGADAQQLGVSAPGQMPPSMIGAEVFKRGIEIPSSEDLTQTQLALLKRAFEGRLK